MASSKPKQLTVNTSAAAHSSEMPSTTVSDPKVPKNLDPRNSTLSSQAYVNPEWEKEFVARRRKNKQYADFDTCICWDTTDEEEDEWDERYYGRRQTYQDVTEFYSPYKRIWLICDLCLTKKEMQEKKELGSDRRDDSFFNATTTVDSPYTPLWLLYMCKQNHFNNCCMHIKKFLMKHFRDQYLDKMIFCHDDNIKRNYQRFLNMENDCLVIPASVETRHLSKVFNYCTAKVHNAKINPRPDML